MGDEHKSAVILLIEDSPSDVLLAREALANSRHPLLLQVVNNGVEAMSYLRKEGRFADAPTPQLILLDLNLPKMDGREVLSRIKVDPHLKHIPVVVLTTSESAQDIDRAYQLHANCYIVKPIDFERFSRVVASIEDFWFSAVSLPTGSLG